MTNGNGSSERTAAIEAASTASARTKPVNATTILSVSTANVVVPMGISIRRGSLAMKSNGARRRP